MGKLRAYVIANCDDAVIFWRADEPIADCLGFAVERERKVDGGAAVRDVLLNRTGFAKDRPEPGSTRPSTQWPFQRFSWTDHDANHGEVVRYRVTPMVNLAGALAQAIELQSEWTEWTELSAATEDGFSVYFNRGLVISQFMARYLEELRVEQGLATLDDALGTFKKSLSKHDLPIRHFLAGELRKQMLSLLEEARLQKLHVWGALYELIDDELISALEKLGARGHIVLANGSIQAAKGEGAANARKRDQNAAARKRLVTAGLEVWKRAISPGALGHNKFLVVTKADETPVAAWTGSTNWTTTGLCTQVNNGLLIQNAEVAAEFLAQWVRLRDAGSEFPKDLVDDNSVPAEVSFGVRRSNTNIWFSRTRGKVDLAAIDEAVNDARDGVLFLMFQPGGAGVLATIRSRLADPKLYVKGVVSTLPRAPAGEVAASRDEESELTVMPFGDGKRHPPLTLDIVQPQGIAHPFASWAATVTRPQFLSGANKVGFAIVHSKLIIVDPFTKPVVITGSHNFSKAASEKNDENFVIVRNNRTLALEYAAHVLSVYHHYRWLSYVADQQRRKKKPFSSLQEKASWQDRFFSGASAREIEFWSRT